MPDALVVIPARHGSTRFPGKVLAALGGIPLVVHACRLAERARRVRSVLVATDDGRVADAVVRAGFAAVMTRADHPSGTDRVAEAAEGDEAQIVLGLQADEPFLAPEDLDALVAALDAGPGAPQLATLSAPLETLADWLDPNVVKIACTRNGRALYFSRSPIPYPRPAHGPLPFPPLAPQPGRSGDNVFFKHIGVYGWQRAALTRFCQLPPSPLEATEGLEQLRALEAGFAIAVLPARGSACGVDTPDDLRRAEDVWARLHSTGKTS